MTAKTTIAQTGGWNYGVTLHAALYIFFIERYLFIHIYLFIQFPDLNFFLKHVNIPFYLVSNVRCESSFSLL